MEQKNKLRPRGGNSPLNDGGLDLSPGDNATYIQLGQELHSLDSVDVHNPHELDKRIKKFFQICADFDTKPAVSGMGIALNLDRRRLWEIATDSPSNNLIVVNMPKDCRELIKRAYQLLEFQLENYLLNGKINPTSGVFLACNHYNYRDVRQVDVVPVQPHDPLSGLTDIETLRQRYLSAVPEYPD